MSLLTRCFTFAESFLNAIPPCRLKSRSIFSPAGSSSVTPAGCEMMRSTCDTCLRERRMPLAYATRAARNVNAFWQLLSRCSTWQQVPNFAISSFTFSSELFTHQGLGGSWPRISTKGHQVSSVLWKMSATLKHTREAGLDWTVVHLHHIQPLELDKHLDEILTSAFKVSYASVRHREHVDHATGSSAALDCFSVT
ncbi:uncharacterized [Tachysurus ichikawai]